MSENTKIEWADHTFNPWEGCTKVGPGCDHCYAETRNTRFAGGTALNWGPGVPRRRTSAANWRKPLAWNAAAADFMAAHGRRQRVFCASLADVFDNEVDPAWRRDLFDLIELTPNLDWLLLTKRIGNVARMVREARTGDWLLGRRNVLLGATIVNQAEADRDIPKLRAVPAARRFLSIEPLLGELDISLFLHDVHLPVGQSIDWVIVGGESGAGARPMHPDWVRDLRDQCAAAGVPFLFKQWGEYHPSCDHDPKSHSDSLETLALNVDGLTEFRPLEVFSLVGETDWEVLCRVGKHAAGRQLDGVQHDGFPRLLP